MVTVDIYYDDHLAHYGVPGMKWGKRKVDREANREVKRQAKSEKFKKKASKVN